MYPATLETSFANPMPSDQRPGHAQLHREINAVVIALQAKLGIDNSLDNTTIDYLVKSSSNPGHTHTKDKVGLGNVANALQLVASNNLSDLVDVTTAVANLGLTFAKNLTLASQAEAEAGVDNTKMMTSLRTKQAIDIFATPIASDAEAAAGVVTTKAINPKQAKDNYGFTIKAGDVILDNNDTLQGTTSATYVKLKETTIGKAGTYRIVYEFATSENGYAVPTQVYKNDVALGTAHSTSVAYPSMTSITDGDYTFAAGDKVQIYGTGNNSRSCYVRNFQLRAIIIPNTVTFVHGL